MAEAVFIVRAGAFLKGIQRLGVIIGEFERVLLLYRPELHKRKQQELGLLELQGIGN